MKYSPTSLRLVGFTLCSLGLALAVHEAKAQSGTWNVDANGTWSTPGNWLGNVIADGSGNTADFNSVNITGDRTVTLDSARIIGNLTFGDATTASNGWILSNGGNSSNALTLDGTTPTITVNALGSGKTALISLELSGTQGLTKGGTGTLVLSGSNSYTGLTAINAGILQVGNGGTTGFLSSGTINVNVASNVIGLQFNRSDAYTVNNTIAGTGRVSIAGTGTAILTGANTYSSFTVVNNGATVQGSDSTKYVGNQTVKSVFGVAFSGSVPTASTIVANSGIDSIQLRANGQDDNSLQILTFAASVLAANGGQTVNIDVNREASSLGTNKTIALSSLNLANPASGTTTVNITGGNGYSLLVSSGLTIGGGATAGSILLNPTTANLTLGNVSNTGSGGVVKNLILGGTSTNNIVTGTISNASSNAALTGVTKSNTSTWTLTATSTYTGSTTITAGTLIVGVSGTGALTGSTVTINAGTLGGTGRITNTVTVGDATGSSDAFIAAGNGATGTLNTGNLSFLSDGVFQFKLNSSTAGGDSLAVTGTVSIDLASQFSFTDLGSSTLTAGTVFTLINNDGTDAITGAFGNLANGSSFTSGANTYQANYAGGDGNDLTLTVVSVPEPGTYALLAAGCLGLWLVRRRQKTILV